MDDPRPALVTLWGSAYAIAGPSSCCAGSVSPLARPDNALAGDAVSQVHRAHCSAAVPAGLLALIDRNFQGFGKEIFTGEAQMGF